MWIFIIPLICLVTLAIVLSIIYWYYENKEYKKEKERKKYKDGRW